VSEPEASDYAKWQHAENVLKGYRARIHPGEYEPEGSPDSAREFSYRAGWKVACFDLGAKWLRGCKLHCAVKGEEHTTQMMILGGTDYQPAVRDGIGVFTGRTFVIRFDDDGNVVAGVAGPGQLSTEKTIEVTTIDMLGNAVDEAVDFVAQTLGVR
jgi:hypothetical protein